MKVAVTIAKVLVGVLFIISGLVKANDPLGLSYKMQEFFDVWTSDLASSHFFLKTGLLSLFSFLTIHSLALSLTIIGLEIMAGIALLIGWQKKAILSLLIVLILFFTFLTYYAYASGKFKNCGCFGDCLPITPLASFVKDLLLVALIVFLFFKRNYIQPSFNSKTQRFVLGFFLVFSIGLQVYVLTYLPLADCLPFKKGASITESLKPPPHAVPDSFAIQFVYQKEGKKFEFLPQNLPADLATYTFVERKDKLIRKGNAEPAIKGFALMDSTEADSTTMVLQQPNAVLYFYETNNTVPESIKNNVSTIYKQAQEKNIPVYVVTTSLERVRQELQSETLKDIQFFNVDFTAFRTAARTNPCIYYLKNGTIIEKRSWHQTNVILKQLKAKR